MNSERSSLGSFVFKLSANAGSTTRPDLGLRLVRLAAGVLVTAAAAASAAFSMRCFFLAAFRLIGFGLSDGSTSVSNFGVADGGRSPLSAFLYAASRRVSIISNSFSRDVYCLLMG